MSPKHADMICRMHCDKAPIPAAGLTSLSVPVFLVPCEVYLNKLLSTVVFCDASHLLTTYDTLSCNLLLKDPWTGP
jgi:hypothetical protein